MLVNWTIETFKWKLAVQKIQRVGFFTAFKAVLSGVSFSVTTPNRVGEYLGRVLYMDEGNRIKAISLTIAGSMSQLLVTLLMGFGGLDHFKITNRKQPDDLLALDGCNVVRCIGGDG